MGMQTVSFITATPFIPKILETLDIYRPPVPLVWNTSGYESVESLKQLDGVIDVYLPDLKHYSASMGKLCAGADDYFEKTSLAIQEMVRQCGVPRYDEDGIMRRGVLIRHWQKARIRDWCRVTIGTKEQMDKFLAAVDDMMKE